MDNVVSFPEKNSWYVDAMELLVHVVQDLSRAQNIETITAIVRTAARELTGADGATFVLREDDQCYYADESAISPLWKGQRFPMKMCVSGWVMLNAQVAAIEDIYKDPRVPSEAYRPTFVKSMLMVPIRQDLPIGAIGNYWAHIHQPTVEEINILQSLANITAVAMENVRLHNELQKKVDTLKKANTALENFIWLSSHELQAPLHAIDDISQWIEESLDRNQYDEAKEHVKLLKGRVGRMERFLKDILDYSQIEYILDPALQTMQVNGSDLLKDVIGLINVPEGFDVQINDQFKKLSLPRMPLQQIFLNLINHSITHNDKNKNGMVTIDCEERENDYLFTMSDNGPGIDPQDQNKMFEMFHVSKSHSVQGGSGLGMALVKKTLDIYGGTITVNSTPRQGSIFTFTWPRKTRATDKN